MVMVMFISLKKMDIQIHAGPSIIVSEGKRYSRSPTLGPTDQATNHTHSDVFLILPLFIQLIDQAILGIQVIPASAVDEAAATSVGCAPVHPVVAAGGSFEAEDVA